MDGFGLFARDARRTFRPGDRVMVYAEVAGFRSKEEHGEGFSLALEATYELAPAVEGGKADVWGPESIEQSSASQVRDLFLTRVIALPAGLKAGMYELRVHVADGISGKTAVGAVMISISE